MPGPAIASSSPNDRPRGPEAFELWQSSIRFAYWIAIRHENCRGAVPLDGPRSLPGRRSGLADQQPAVPLTVPIPTVGEPLLDCVAV
jgi:hypothetical protein